MSFKLIISGVPVIAENAAEAAQLLRELGRDFKGETSKSSAATHDEGLKSNIQALKIAHAFLTTIRDAGDRGANAEKIMKALNTDTPKGVGGRMIPVNRALTGLGFNPASVYDNNNRVDGVRMWTKKKRFQEAMEVITEKLSEGDWLL